MGSLKSRVFTAVFGNVAEPGVHMDADRLNSDEFERNMLEITSERPGDTNIRRAVWGWLAPHNRRGRYTVYARTVKLWWNGYVYLSPTLRIFPTVKGQERLADLNNGADQ